MVKSDEYLPINSRLSIHYAQSTRSHTVKADRATIESSFRSFGSYLAFVIRFTQLLVGKFQRFSIDNSMVKKLYTCDDSDDEGSSKPKKPKPNLENEEGNELLFNHDTQGNEKTDDNDK